MAGPSTEVEARVRRMLQEAQDKAAQLESQPRVPRAAHVELSIRIAVLEEALGLPPRF